LIERSENKSEYDRVLQRIHRLIERVPEARTASLEVMLLQADYFRAETLMSKWMADRTEDSARQEAAEILARIAPQLDQRQEQLRGAVDKLQGQVDAAPVTDDQAVQVRELNRLQSVAGRAAFFAAWSNYYLALAQPADSTAPGFLRAREIFRRILGVDGSYSERDPAGLGLESIWRARTLIGLGLAEAASGNVDGSRACFELLDRSPAPPEVRELSPYWRTQALLNAGRIQDAIAFAQPLVATFTGSASQGKVSFCVALVRAGFGGPQPPPPAHHELGMIGITGLIKLRQQSALRHLLEKYPIPIDVQAGFYLAWLHAQQQLEAAEKSQRQEDYATAERAFAAALATPDAASDLAGASQCRYQHAWCLYKTDQLETAARTYEAALDGLKATDTKTAADSAWMAFLCYQSLARSNRKYVQSAVNVLRGLQRDFPDHPYAQRAEYYAGRLQQAALPLAETLANLERVPASSPDYLSARYDICQLLYEQWSKSNGDKQVLGPKLLAAVDEFLAAAPAGSDVSRRLRGALIAADVALNGASPDEVSAAKYLEMAGRWVEGQPAGGLAAEYHYRSLQRSAKRNDPAGRRRHADWLVKNAAGSPFELPALVVVAKAVDDQVLDPSATTRTQLEEGKRVYERLVAHLGDDPQVLQSTKNAQVAASRLAYYCAELGQHAAASQLLAKLLVVFPTDPGYLRRAGLSAFQAAEYDTAREYWRKLVLGLPKEGDTWYEAKYYQLACLVRLDREQARQALAQYRLLYPDLGPPAWRGRFAELQQQVE
jgi:tetratricopeptide (TPR) repeat protein